MLLFEGVPPPIGLLLGQTELLSPLERTDKVDDGSAAELVLVFPAEGNHHLLLLVAEAHLFQDGHPLLISLA